MSSSKFYLHLHTVQKREKKELSLRFSPQDPLTNTLMVLLIPGLRLLSHLDSSRQQRWECRGQAEQSPPKVTHMVDWAAGYLGSASFSLF